MIALTALVAAMMLVQKGDPLEVAAKARNYSPAALGYARTYKLSKVTFPGADISFECPHKVKIEKLPEFNRDGFNVTGSRFSIDEDPLLSLAKFPYGMEGSVQHFAKPIKDEDFWTSFESAAMKALVSGVAAQSTTLHNVALTDLKVVNAFKFSDSHPELRVYSATRQETSIVRGTTRLDNSEVLIIFANTPTEFVKIVCQVHQMWPISQPPADGMKFEDYDAAQNLLMTRILSTIKFGK